MDPLKSGQTSRVIFTPELIRKQLDLLREAEIMRSSEVLLRFLEFVVEETLSERVYEIKEYTIGINVFKRPSTFNPQSDAIVRINAGRLRKLLKQYYDSAGQNDPVRIDLPRGGYIPTFDRVQKPVQPETDEGIIEHKPALAVIPFHNVGPDSAMNYFGDGFGDQLCSAISQFQELSAISYYSTRRLGSKDADFRILGRYLGAQYILTGSFRFSGKNLRLNVQLIFADDATQIWSDTYNREWNEAELFVIQDDLAARILSNIGGFQGAIVQHMSHASRSQRLKTLGINNALYWFNYYKNNYSVDSLLQARLAIEETLRINPDYALGWAVYSEIFSDSVILQAHWIGNPLEVSLQHAERSLQLNPSSQQGHLALAFASLLSHDKKTTVEAASKCIALNPYSAGHKGMAGAYMVCAGNYEEGIRYLNSSIETNPNYFWCLNVGLSLYHFKMKDFTTANEKASLIRNDSTIFGPLMQAASSGKLSAPESKSLPSQTRLKRSPPEQSAALLALQTLVLDNELINDIMEGLLLSGTDIMFPNATHRTQA